MVCRVEIGAKVSGAGTGSVNGLGKGGLAGRAVGAYCFELCGVMLVKLRRILEIVPAPDTLAPNR